MSNVDRRTILATGALALAGAACWHSANPRRASSHVCRGLHRPVHAPTWIGVSQGIDHMASVRDNKAQNRFELDVEGAVAFANYRVTPAAVVITHTETPRALRGRGIASELIKGALELIRADGRKVIAGCGFVVDYLRKNPEFADLAG